MSEFKIVLPGVHGRRLPETPMLVDVPLSAPASPWNSLEVVKLLFGLLTPAMVAVFGLYLQRVTERLQREQLANQKILEQHLQNQQWTNQKIVERRLAIYDEIAPLLNQLLCYFTYVGAWREIDPPDMIKLKRDLDRKLHLAAPLFPAVWAYKARAFTHGCFKTFGLAWGGNAQLRTPWKNRVKVHARPWKEDWEACFCEEVVQPVEIQQLYQSVLAEFSRSFGELDFVPSDALAPVPKDWQQMPDTPPEL